MQGPGKHVRRSRCVQANAAGPAAACCNSTVAPPNVPQVAPLLDVGQVHERSTAGGGASRSSARARQACGRRGAAAALHPAVLACRVQQGIIGLGWEAEQAGRGRRASTSRRIPGGCIQACSCKRNPNQLHHMQLRQPPLTAHGAAAGPCGASRRTPAVGALPAGCLALRSAHRAAQVAGASRCGRQSGQSSCPTAPCRAAASQHAAAGDGPSRAAGRLSRLLLGLNVLSQAEKQRCIGCEVGRHPEFAACSAARPGEASTGTPATAAALKNSPQVHAKQ